MTDAHEVHSIRALFRERRLSLRTMSPSLRVATAGAAASLLATIVLVALRDVHGGAVYLGRDNGVVTSISAPLFTATLVLLSIGFGYVLAAAAVADRRVGIPVTVIVVGGVGLYTGAFGHLIGGLNFLDVLPQWAHWASRGLLLAMALLAVLSLSLDRSSASAAVRLRPYRLLLIVAFSLLFGGYLFVLRAASPTLGGLNNFGPIAAGLFGQLIFVMYPILQVAAIDFGEWGQLTGERVAGFTAERSRRALPVLAVLCCLVLAGYAYSRTKPHTSLWSGTRLGESGRQLLMTAALLLVVIGIGYVLRLHRTSWPSSLNFAALVAVCALTAVVLPPIAGHLSGLFAAKKPVTSVEDGRFTAAADVVPLTPTGQPPFSVLVPRGWIPIRQQAEVAATSYGPGGAYERIILQKGPALSVTLAGKAFNIKAEETRSVGDWQMVSGTAPGFTHMEVWVRPAPDANNGGSYIALAATRGTFPDAPETFAAIVDSFRPAGQAVAELPSGEGSTTADQRLDDRLRLVGVALELGVFIVLLGLALLTRRRSKKLIAALLLLGMATVFEIAFFLDQIGRALAGSGAHWPFLTRSGVLLSSGVIGAIVVAVAWRVRGTASPLVRALARGLVALCAALYVLDRMDALYQHALSASRVSVWAALVVLIAMAWDVTMSGESMTNEGSRRFPRETRVLAFFGYVIALGATVVFFTAQHVVASGDKAEPAFEPESVTQAALFRVALPLLLLLFLLRLCGGGRSSSGHGPAIAPGGGESARADQPAASVTAEGSEAMDRV